MTCFTHMKIQYSSNYIRLPDQSEHRLQVSCYLFTDANAKCWLGDILGLSNGLPAKKTSFCE